MRQNELSLLIAKARMEGIDYEGSQQVTVSNVAARAKASDNGPVPLWILLKARKEAKKQIRREKNGDQGRAAYDAKVGLNQDDSDTMLDVDDGEVQRPAQ